MRVDHTGLGELHWKVYGCLNEQNQRFLDTVKWNVPKLILAQNKVIKMFYYSASK